MRDDMKPEPWRERPTADVRSSLAQAIEAARAERTFYQAGRVAFREKKNEAACPYPGSSMRAKLWLQGFAETKEADEVKRARFLR